MEIDNYYKPVIRGVELLNSGDFNGLFLLGKAGTGKSFQVDQTLNRINANYKIFKGEISEAKFWEFIQENNGKMLVFRDTARLLRRLSFIDTLKSMTENIPHRIISRMTYAKHEEKTKEEFEFTGKVLFEINEIMKKYKEDLASLFTRGLFIELNLSRKDMIDIMLKICNEDKTKIIITKYLLDKFKGYNLNLRLQNMCFKIYDASIKDKLDWKKQIDLYLNSQVEESRKLLYRFTGLGSCKRIEFAKYLISQMNWSYATCFRRINEWLLLDEIFSDGKHTKSLISLNPFPVSTVSKKS